MGAVNRSVVPAGFPTRKEIKDLLRTRLSDRDAQTLLLNWPKVVGAAMAELEEARQQRDDALVLRDAANALTEQFRRELAKHPISE